MLFISLKCFLLISQTLLVNHVQSTVLTVEASKDKKTSSIFLQDGDRQCVESNAGASTEEADEQEGLERVRLRN